MREPAPPPPPAPPAARRVQAGILLQHRGLQVTQVPAGVDAQFLPEGVPQPVVDDECVCLPAAAVQSQHELPVDPLVQRVVGHHLLQLGNKPGVLSRCQPGLRQFLPDAHLEQVQALGLRRQPGQFRDIGQRPAPPQRQRVAWAKDQGYEPGLWIDRIDPDADYRPANCRWITARENILRAGRILHDEDENRMTALRARTGQSVADIAELALDAFLPPLERTPS